MGNELTTSAKDSLASTSTSRWYYYRLSARQNKRKGYFHEMTSPSIFHRKGLDTTVRQQQTGLSDLPLNSTRNLPATRYVIEVYTRPTTPPTDRQIDLPFHRLNAYPSAQQKVPQLHPPRGTRSEKYVNNNHGTHTFVGCSSSAGRQVPIHLSISRGCSNVWRMLMVPKGRTRGLEKRGVRVTTLALLYCCTRATTFRTWWHLFLLLSILPDLPERCQKR